MTHSSWTAVAAVLAALLGVPTAAASAAPATSGLARERVAPLGAEEPADYTGQVAPVGELEREVTSRLTALWGTEPVTLSVAEEGQMTGVEASVQGLGYDADGDGVEDLIGAGFDHGTQTLTSFVWSGADGSEIRSSVVAADDPYFFVALVAPDLTGDGIRDEVRMTLARIESSESCDEDPDVPPYHCERTYLWHVDAVSGRDGAVVWTRVLEGYLRIDDDGSTRTVEALNNGAQSYFFPEVQLAGDRDGDGTPDLVIREMYIEFVDEDGEWPEDSGGATATIVGRDGTTLGTFALEVGRGIPQLHVVGDLVGDSAPDFLWVARYHEVEEWTETECPLPGSVVPPERQKELGLCETQEFERHHNRMRVDVVDGNTLTHERTTMTTDKNIGSNVSFPVVFADHDLTADGMIDVVLGFLGFSVVNPDSHSAAHLLDGTTGDQVWSRELPGFQLPEHSTDIDGDGDREVVFAGGIFSSNLTGGGTEGAFYSTALDGATGEVAREHHDSLTYSAEQGTSFHVRPGDLNGDGIPERGWGWTVGRRDTPDDPIQWESFIRIFDGGVEQREVLNGDGPRRRLWSEAYDLDRDGVSEILEHDQAHDRNGPVTLRAIDAAANIRWEHRDAAEIAAVGGLDGGGADLIATHTLAEGTHVRTTILRLDGADAGQIWARVLG